MKYLFKLFLSLKEIFIVMTVQYVILLLYYIVFGEGSSILGISTIIALIQIIYIILKGKGLKFSFKGQVYLPYILLGIGVASVYNMIIFSLGLESEVNIGAPIIFNILFSGIIGPIFEEVLFRYALTRRLEKFNTKKLVIIILSSIIFSLMHTGITTIVYAFIMGIIFSYFYYKDRSIITPIIIHMSSNIFVTFLSGYNTLILILGIILIIMGLLIIRNSD